MSTAIAVSHGRASLGSSPNPAVGAKHGLLCELTFPQLRLDANMAYTLCQVSSLTLYEVQAQSVSYVLILYTQDWGRTLKLALRHDARRGPAI